MSYIINNTDAFVNIKLTQAGRQKLAQGQLNFTSWGIGDSEINYDREDIHDNNITDVRLSGTSKVLRPFDNEPDIKSFITATSNNNGNLNPLNSSQITTIQAIVNNQATERGFFSGDGTTYITYTGDTYIQAQGSISGSSITGGTSLVIGTGYTYNDGDFILLKLGNDTIGSLTDNQNTTPVPHLWYRITSITTTTNLNDTVILDRDLPNNLATSATTQWIIYTSDEVYGGFGFQETTPYWNTNTLAFAGCCDISCGDVPIWNMNNVWCENMVGMSGTGVNNIPATPYQSFEKFGSNAYLGQKYPYFEYSCNEGVITDLDVCGVPGESSLDGTKKSISIVHYTNNTVSNYYGEYFFIDGANNKELRLTLPDLMYHRRNYATETGTTMGMDFIATGTTQLLGTSDVQYVDLIEDPTMVSGTPSVVGKVFPQLKTVVFDDDEIVAAMSYKSNRNWTLPPLSASMVASASGATGGILPVGKTMFLTYTFENSTGTGLTTTLPCQYYTKITNNTSNTKDVQFKIGDIDLLPYMRKEEKVGYDGMGFSAREFKLVYQIVDDADDRPLADGWSEYDYTSTAITSVTGETIDPLLLEVQNPLSTGFLIDSNVTASATTFTIMPSLNMMTNASDSGLQFGDERFFYGNLETYIGATIYKTVFNLNISADDFKTTANPTRLNSDPNPPDIRVTEVGIYDSTGVLVMIGKLSAPVKLSSGNTIMVELAMDF
jgi:hypothetical protein